MRREPRTFQEVRDDLNQRVWAVLEPPLQRCADFLSKLLGGKGKA